MKSFAIEMRIPHKGPAAVLTKVERQLHPPNPGEVRVAMEAIGVAYVDIVVRQGIVRDQRPPITPGNDFVGRIAAIGDNVSGYSIGQRVVGVTTGGCYVTERNIDARWIVPAPETADPIKLVAAALNGVTAWQMFHRLAKADPQEWILVHGAAGGVGTLLLELARLSNVRAIGTASLGKAQIVTSRGAVHIDYRADKLVERVRRTSDGGVVAAFDHIGGGHVKKVSLAALRPGGICVVYGFYNMTRDGRLRAVALADIAINSLLSSVRLFESSQGVVAYHAPDWKEHRLNAYRQDLRSIVGLVADGTLSPLIGATFPLADAAAAHRALETRSVAGKIVLIP
jgi:NADPH:quinone reductase-like Zn-dependent oxidoreductase